MNAANTTGLLVMQMLRGEGRPMRAAPFLPAPKDPHPIWPVTNGTDVGQPGKEPVAILGGQ